MGEEDQKNKKRESPIYEQTHSEKGQLFFHFSPLLTSFVLIDFRLMYVPLDAC